LWDATVLGRENPWTELFDPNRIKPRASATEFVKENVSVARHFFGDRISRRASVSIDQLGLGEGQVIGVGRKQLAVSRDSDGNLHALSARCTHMGCIVNWNAAEQTWDCPCHGSRFATDGAVLEGPAVAALESRPDNLSAGAQEDR
jgi:Rieske Fe-S protein